MEEFKFLRVRQADTLQFHLRFGDTTAITLIQSIEVTKLKSHAVI